MKTKDPTTPNGSDQDRTISGSITKSRRRSITIRFPKAYITEYRKRKMLERMSTTTPTSQNALDVSYAGQDQGKLDEGNKSERTSIIIKFPKAYIHKLQQDTVVEHAAHEDKSQSAGIQSKKSASPHGSNALGLDNTAKASATEIERHEDALAGPDMKAISATFSTAQERQNLAKTPPRIRLIFHKDKKAKTAWAKLHNKKDALVQKSTIAADALAQQPFEAPVKAEAEETQQEKAQLHNKEDAVVQKSNVAKRSEEPVKTEAEQRHQEKMKKIDAMMIPADPESKARLEEIGKEENSAYGGFRIGKTFYTRPAGARRMTAGARRMTAGARRMTAWVKRMKRKMGQSEEEWENPFDMDGEEFLEYDAETSRRKIIFKGENGDEE